MRLVLAASVGDQIVSAFGNGVSVLFSFIPAIIGAVILLLIGWIVATIIKNVLVRVLRAVHFDQAMDHAGVGSFLQRGGVRMDAADVLATVVYWFVFLIFIVAAANALAVPAITGILNAIVLWLPQLFVALLVVIVGMLLARVVGDIVRDAAQGAGLQGARFLAGITRVAILAFAFIIALSQIGVGAVIVQELFAAAVFGIALALALAFGLGGRDTAKNIVDSWYGSMMSGQTRQAAQQATNRPMTDGAGRPDGTSRTVTTYPVAPASEGYVREAGGQTPAPTA